MFTGLVENMGSVREFVRSHGGVRLGISTDASSFGVGDSVAVSGACLTVVECSAAGFSADISEETLARTTLGGLQIGAQVNLERPLTLGSALGGHLVAGHVDALGSVTRIEPLAGSSSLTFGVPGNLGRYLAEKGSVCVDGVSLTINAVTATTFDVMIIPHTLKVTTLGQLKLGDNVNLEIDLLARYVVRWLEFQNGSKN